MGKEVSKIGDYTDNELLKRIAVNTKKSADALTFLKNFFIGTAIVSIIFALIILSKLG